MSLLIAAAALPEIRNELCQVNEFHCSSSVYVIAPDIPSSSIARLTSFLRTGSMASRSKECFEDIIFVLEALGVKRGCLLLTGSGSMETNKSENRSVQAQGGPLFGDWKNDQEQSYIPGNFDENMGWNTLEPSIVFMSEVCLK